LPSIRLSQARAGRSRFRLRRGEAGAPTVAGWRGSHLADLSRLVDRCGGVVQKAGSGIIL